MIPCDWVLSPNRYYHELKPKDRLGTGAMTESIRLQPTAVGTRGLFTRSDLEGPAVYELIARPVYRQTAGTSVWRSLSENIDPESVFTPRPRRQHA